MAAIAVVLMSSSAGWADSPSTAGTIAFEAIAPCQPPCESVSTIYTIDASGTGTPRVLATGVHTPSWSPNGAKLVTSGAGLTVINVADGTTTKLVPGTGGQLDSSWSPKGDQIAYADTANGHVGIYVVPAAGGTPTLLRSHGIEWSPVWSPDGTKIAFLESPITANPPNIWIMNADGSDPHELMTADVPDPGGLDLCNLAWSPDGTQLAYSTGAEPEVYGVGLRPASIAVVSVDGSNEHILVAPPDGRADFTDPSWSPDGTNIIFSDAPLSGPSPPTTQGLDIANADGTNRRTLLTAPGGYNVNSAQWLPGVPSAPTGPAASAGDGQATVSFSAPATNGGAPITSYTVTASPGGASATGFAGPLTVTGLSDGTSYTFSIVAANRIGAGSAATASATPIAPSGGGGGGGGGGGSSGIPPDLHVDISASSTTVPAVGAALDYFITVSSKNSGGSSETTLRLALPAGYAVVSTYSDRGPGCTGAAPNLTCNVAFINPTASTHVRISGTVGQAGEQDLTASVSGYPEPELNPADNSLTLKLLPPPSPTTGDSGNSGGSTTLAALTPPHLSGNATVGSTLHAVSPKWSDPPTHVSYQWQLCAHAVCRPIPGATTKTLTIRRSYLGKTVRVVVTGKIGQQQVRSTSIKLAVRA